MSNILQICLFFDHLFVYSWLGSILALLVLSAFSVVKTVVSIGSGVSVSTVSGSVVWSWGFFVFLGGLVGLLAGFGVVFGAGFEVDFFVVGLVVVVVVGFGVVFEVGFAVVVDADFVVLGGAVVLEGLTVVVVEIGFAVVDGPVVASGSGGGVTVDMMGGTNPGGKL